MPERFVPLTTAASAFEARLVAARLGADGILCQLQGNVDGPYPVGPVQVLVPAEDAEVARQLLLVDEVEEAFVAAEHDGATPRRARALDAWIVVLAIVGVIAFTLARTLG